jgi:hypothetical protein
MTWIRLVAENFGWGPGTVSHGLNGIGVTEQQQQQQQQQQQNSHFLTFCRMFLYLCL